MTPLFFFFGGGGGGGDGYFFPQEIVYLCYPYAVYQISMSYYASNMYESFWWVGGMVVCKPILVFILGQAEQ